MLVLGGVLGLLFFSAALMRWNDLTCRGKSLPGGTLGWPLFGETMEFLKHGPNFMKNQRLRSSSLLLFYFPSLSPSILTGNFFFCRYGALFKTHILGCPTVVSTDPDVNKFIFMNEGKGFVPGYPQSMLDILGKWNMAAVHGGLHKSMRGLLLSLIGPSAIREELLPKIDSFMQSYLDGLSGQIFDIQEKTREVYGLCSFNPSSVD